MNEHLKHPPSFGWPNVFSFEGQGLTIEDVWPSLYTGQERADEIERKIGCLPWAKEAIEVWKLEAETVLGEAPHFVPGTSGARNSMHLDGHGQHLLFDHTQCDRMWDPVACAYIRPDEALQNAWVTLCHERIRRLMISLAFLYRLTGDGRYSRWVWKGLQRTVTQLYEHPPVPADGDVPKGTVFYGGLYEAQCMLQLVQAYQLVRNAPGGSEADGQRLNEVVFEQVGNALSDWMDVMPVHNMSCWAMSALAVMGRRPSDPGTHIAIGTSYCFLVFFTYI